MTQSAADPELLVRRAWLSYIGGGVPAMLEHCTPDVVWRSMLADGRRIEGADAISTMFQELVSRGVWHTAVPYRYSVVGGRVVASVDVQLAHDGLPGAETGQVFIVYAFQDGRISEICEYLTVADALAAAQDG